MAIRILTDSSSDLTEEMIGEHQIDIMPFFVYVDEEEFEDGISIKSSDVPKAMLEGKNVRTAQVPMVQFKDYFERSAPNDQILCFPISSGLSGTYQTAAQTAQMVMEERPELDIRVIDTKTTSLALGILVMQAAEMVRQGANIDEIERFVREEAEYMKLLFTVPSLKWLLQGGRVSKAQAAMGTLLDIKPILHVLDGKLIPFDKVRGKKQRFQKLTRFVRANCKSMKGKKVGICHSANPEEAERMAEFLKRELEADEIYIKEIGAVIASHTGPGLLAVFFRGDEKESVLS